MINLNKAISSSSTTTSSTLSQSSSSSSSVYQVIVTKVSPHDMLLGLGPAAPVLLLSEDDEEKRLDRDQQQQQHAGNFNLARTSTASSVPRLFRRFLTKDDGDEQGTYEDVIEEEDNIDDNNTLSSPVLIQIVVALYVKKPLRLLRYSLSFPASSGWFTPAVNKRGERDGDVNKGLIGKLLKPPERHFYPGSSSVNSSSVSSNHRVSNVSSSFPPSPSSLSSPQQREPILVALALKAERLLSASLSVTAALFCEFEIVDDDDFDDYSDVRIIRVENEGNNVIEEGEDDDDDKKRILVVEERNLVFKIV